MFTDKILIKFKFVDQNVQDYSVTISRSVYLKETYGELLAYLSFHLYPKFDDLNQKDKVFSSDGDSSLSSQACCPFDLVKTIDYYYNNVHLKSHYYIGVLYDFYVGIRHFPFIPIHLLNKKEETIDIIDSRDFYHIDKAHPIEDTWEIDIRTTSALLKDAMILAHPDYDLREIFLSNLKQANFLMFGNVKKIMKLSKKDTLDMYVTVLEENEESYDRISQHIRPLSVDLYKFAKSIQHIPVRVILKPSFTIIQRLVSPYIGDSQLLTVRLFLSMTVREELVKLYDIKEVTKIKYYINNAPSIPYHVSLIFVYRQYSYPDHFLYIIIEVE